MNHGVARSVLAILAALSLALLAWEVAEAAVGHQASVPLPFPFLIAIALAAIALAEYLWVADGGVMARPSPGHYVTRIALVVLEAVVGASAIEGGLALLRGALDPFVSVAWLAGTPFNDYTIPGLTLVIVVGGGTLLAAATVFIRREWAVAVSALAGVLMAGYEAVEIVAIDGKVGNALPIALGLQLLFFMLGLAIFALAWSLWAREYPLRRLRLRHASHA